jgi:hypothetical protein
LDFTARVSLLSGLYFEEALPDWLNRPLPISALSCFR